MRKRERIREFSEEYLNLAKFPIKKISTCTVLVLLVPGTNYNSIMLRSVVAVVSGGASGLGAATASAIVQRGGRVVIADLPNAKNNFLRLAATACAEAHGSSGKVAQRFSGDYQPHVQHKNRHEGREVSGPLMIFAETDVRSEQNIVDALDLAEAKFGEPVNTVVNCAGICPTRKILSKNKLPSDESGEDTVRVLVHNLDEFREVLEINTLGTFNLSRLAAERMAQREADTEGLRGCIINTASIAAFEGRTGQVAYAASKGAIVGMTLPLARDLAPHGIRVMAVAPGICKTQMMDDLPMEAVNDLSKLVPCPSRLGHPEEFGRLVVSILMNPMLNGEVIRLDGALRLPI